MSALRLPYFLFGLTIGILICDYAWADTRPMYLCRSKTHATIVGRKAEACPTYVTEKKTRAQLKQAMRAALGIYGKREVEGAIRSFRCEWQ